MPQSPNTPSSRSSLAYYITAHGYGHGARSCDILAALVRARPDVVLHVVSDLPQEFLAARLPAGNIRFRPGRFDAGMVQLDSIRVDVDATLREARDLLPQEGELVAAEQEFLKRESIRIVVADLPAIPLMAARGLGLPAIGVGNFSWDWIYEDFIARDGGWQAVVDHFRRGYGMSDVLLRLPFAEPMASFPRQRDIALVARPGANCRDEIARRTGARPDRTWVLLLFSTLEWDDRALARVEELEGYEFFAVRPLAWEGSNIHTIDRREFPYSDVLASCDIVVTKPGYGVLSECAVNDKPVVYAERTDFREYPVLEAAVRRYFRHQHLPAEQLYRGHLGAALDAVRRAPPPADRLAAGGDDEAARIILDLSG